jgi:hypothetical protein
MMLVPAGVRVHIALGVTDMRKGLDGLAMLVQGVLEQDPFSGHLFAFRGRKANLIKIVFWDGTGLCLFTKQLEDGRFGTISMERRLRAILAVAVFDHSCLMEERGRHACDDGRIATDDTWTRRHAASRRSDLSRTYWRSDGRRNFGLFVAPPVLDLDQCRWRTRAYHVPM